MCVYQTKGFTSSGTNYILVWPTHRENFHWRMWEVSTTQLMFGICAVRHHGLQVSLEAARGDRGCNRALGGADNMQQRCLQREVVLADSLLYFKNYNNQCCSDPNHNSHTSQMHCTFADYLQPIHLGLKYHDNGIFHNKWLQCPSWTNDLLPLPADIQCIDLLLRCILPFVNYLYWCISE